MSAEWVMAAVSICTSIGGVVTVAFTVGAGYKKTLATIETGQALAKQREDGHSKAIGEIKATLEDIKKGEAICQRSFEHRITVVESQAKSTQVELTEFKVELKGGM